MARILAKRHSVDDDCHSASMDSRESLTLGTHLTFLRVSDTSRPRSSRAVIGMSPIAVQRCRRPSMPAT
eukprot:6186844-Pleurochrysis_carterae.AAC.2